MNRTAEDLKGMPKKDKQAVIYAGRRQLCIEGINRLYDTFQGIIFGVETEIRMNLDSAGVDYTTEGLRMANVLHSRGAGAFRFKNGFLYSSETGEIRRFEIVDGVRTEIERVPQEKLQEFRRGLLSLLHGVQK